MMSYIPNWSKKIGFPIPVRKEEVDKGDNRQNDSFGVDLLSFFYPC